MSENLEPIETDPESIAPLSHQRILWMMAIVALAAAILSSIFVSLQFGIGILIGGGLAFINYYWIKVSLKRIFEKAVAGEKASFLGANYFLRYLFVGAVIFIIYLTKVVPIVAVLLGLCVFAAAIVIEGLLRILSSISKREEF